VFAKALNTSRKLSHTKRCSVYAPIARPKDVINQVFGCEHRRYGIMHDNPIDLPRRMAQLKICDWASHVYLYFPSMNTCRASVAYVLAAVLHKHNVREADSRLCSEYYHVRTSRCDINRNFRTHMRHHSYHSAKKQISIDRGGAPSSMTRA
jgi:hypothetical protein